MSSGDEASLPDGKAGMGTDFDNYHLADDRNSSDDLAAPSEEEDGSVEVELIDHHPEGSKVLRLTGNHCRGNCFLKQSNGLKANCVCGKLESDCTSTKSHQRIQLVGTLKPS